MKITPKSRQWVNGLWVEKGEVLEAGEHPTTDYYYIVGANWVAPKACWEVVTETEVAKRYDDGKVDFTLIPVDAQEAEARVWEMGEKKYGRDNWTKLWGEDSRVKIMKSLLRHAYAILRGEDIDDESKLPHAAHIRCNCAMLIRDYENRKANK